MWTHIRCNSRSRCLDTWRRFDTGWCRCPGSWARGISRGGIAQRGCGSFRTSGWPLKCKKGWYNKMHKSMLKRIYIKIGYEILAKKSDKCTHPHRLGSVYKAGTRTCFFEEHILCRRDNSNSVIKKQLVSNFYTRTAYKCWFKQLKEINVVLTQERKRQSTPDIADRARICRYKQKVQWKWNTEWHWFFLACQPFPFQYYLAILLSLVCQVWHLVWI